jgi:hypothetical protein
MRATALLPLLVTGFLVSGVTYAAEPAAPFGFSWGPVQNIPRPSLAAREENITQLIYRRDRLPANELQDTDEIVLEVCKNEGLQQILWFSRSLSASEERGKLDAILAEGRRRFGTADKIDQDLVTWTAGRTTVARIAGAQDQFRLIMISTGPAFDSCSDAHRSATGHPVSDHWMRFLPGNAAR